MSFVEQAIKKLQESRAASRAPEAEAPSGHALVSDKPVPAGRTISAAVLPL